MSASKVSSPARGYGGHGPEYTKVQHLADIDYAFIVMRLIVITGGFFWLVFHPYPDTLKFQLLGLFLIFTIYSFSIHGLILAWYQKADMIYPVFLALDIVFTGRFISLTGGFDSIVFVIVYLLVAVHSFYFGLSKGIALSTIISLVYIITGYDQWGVVHWTDPLFKIAVIFLIAGFLGFITEKERRDRDRLLNTQLKLNSIQEELERSYKNLRDIKTQIEQSERLASIGRLSAELAHEINNPLDGIKNCLTVIKKESASAEQKKMYLELIDEAVYNIEGAVKDILDYAKRHEPVWQEVNVIDILKRTILMADYKLQKNKIDVKTGFENDIPYVIGDPHQLQEVFFNIIINAVDAMPDGGRLVVVVEARGSGNSIDIKITDTGIGIPQKDLQNIFQPFYTTKPFGEGTGLGLPVSLDIIKRHNGIINVSSEVGVGTIFHIILPVLRENYVV